MIWRIHLSVDFMDSWSVFGFTPKHAKSVFGFLPKNAPLLHVYDKRQTSDPRWEFLKIEQVKAILTNKKFRETTNLGVETNEQ